MVNGWKITAIVFIILFCLVVSFNILSWWAYESETKKINECYYDICEQYTEAYYEDGVCKCYEVDLLGEYTLAKSKYMK